MGIPIPDETQGGIPGEVGHPIVIESTTLPAVHYAGDWRVLIEGDMKLIWNSLGRHRLFDLAADPGESEDLAAARPERVAAMQQTLERYLASLPPPGPEPPPREVDPETRDTLRALGYLAD